MKERLHKLLESKSLTASQLADKLGVQRSGISHILSGRNKPSIDFLQKLMKVYPDIDIRWLVSGNQGVKQANPQQDLFRQADNEVTREEKSAIKDEEPVTYNTVGKQHTPLRTEKNAEKIVIFYSDNTFEVYYPDGK